MERASLNGIDAVRLPAPSMHSDTPVAGGPSFASVRQAVAAARAGQTVRIAPGHYRVSPQELPLQIERPGVAIEAAGNGPAILEAVGAYETESYSTALIEIAADDVTIAGLSLRNATQSIRAEGVARCTIRDNRFDGAKRDHIVLRDVRDFEVRGNHSRGSNGRFAVITGARGGFIESNRVHEQSAGLRLTNSSGVRIFRNTFTGLAWDAIGLMQSSGIDMVENLIEGGRLTGLQIRGSSGNRVTGNTVRNNRTEGILLDRGSHANTVSNNQIYGNGTGLANETGDAVNATGNWWGSPRGPGPNDVDGKAIVSGWLKKAP